VREAVERILDYVESPDAQRNALLEQRERIDRKLIQLSEG
jgi:hypothetical protein